MTSDEGLRLLLPDPTEREKNKDEGIRIVDRLGGLALAIDQAAAYIDDREITIEDFLPTYEEERKKILEYTPDHGWEYSTIQLDEQVVKDKALSAFTTWNMSFQRLFLNNPQKQEYALHFLTLHAFLEYLNIAEDLFRIFWQDGASIPEWLTIFVEPTEADSDSDSPSPKRDFPSDDDSVAKTHSSDGQSRRLPPSKNTVQRGPKPHSQDIRTRNEWKSTLFLDLRAKCRHLSLLRVQSDNNQPDRKYQIFSLHPLIRDWLQLRVKKNERRSYFQEAIRIILVSIRSFNGRNTTANQKKVLLANMDAYISNDKRFSKSGKSFGYIDSNTATIFGEMYWNQGRWKEAEELVVQIIETRKRESGPEHPDTLTSIANLATTYRNQGRWKEAEELGVQVIETRKRLLGQEHPSTLTSMNNLASTYRNQGRWKEAEELGVQVIEIRKRVLGPEHPDTLTSMNNLAFTWKNQKRDAEALDLISSCVELSTRKLGANHPNTLISTRAYNTWKLE
jgi:tetratricopeptide (TPR) repeat protein